MATIHFGCQTYPWQMSYDKYAGRMDHMLDVVRRSGMTGVEAEVCMMGDYYDPAKFQAELDKNGLSLAALTYTAYWPNGQESDEERQGADEAIAFLKHFPGAKLCLCQLPGDDRENLLQRQKNALQCLNAAAKRAADAGIDCVFHPNSPMNSIFRYKPDYDVLCAGLQVETLGLAIDSGHLLNGGVDLYAFIREARPLIRHIHFKDIDSQHVWASMGEGITDFPTVVDYFRETGYDGWIMIEEESKAAEADPDSVTLHNGRYVQEYLVK